MKSAFQNKLKERTWNVRGYKDPIRALNIHKDRMKHELLYTLSGWVFKSGILLSSVDFTSWIRVEIELKTVPFFMELCRHY